MIFLLSLLDSLYILTYNIGERRWQDGKIKIRIFESAIYIAYCANSTE